MATGAAFIAAHSGDQAVLAKIMAMASWRKRNKREEMMTEEKI